jgi:predicted kinase
LPEPYERSTMASMSQPVLYLMIGYPGAGKTTVSKFIHELTGAEHLWSDHIRHQLFKNPTHSKVESLELYTYLNDLTDKLLSERKSVIFDTNFNFYKDREYLRTIATKNQAKTILIWVTTPIETARSRATEQSHGQHTRVWGNMPITDFKRISNNLEPPKSNEAPVKIDGAAVTKSDVEKLLKQS